MERKPGSTSKPQFLMVTPDHYRISYVINPWMEGNINRTALEKAQNQWENLYKIVSGFADVQLMDGRDGLPDMVFTANAGLVIENRVLLARFYHPERRGEEELFSEWFESNGFKVAQIPEGIFFEGAGDALLDCDGRWLWAGYGLRSSLESHPYIAETFNIETLSLRLTDKRFYHLDTCFCPLPKGYLMYIPSAFDAPSNRLIEERIAPDKRIVLDEVEAPAFSANAVAIGETIIMNHCFPSLRQKLARAGFSVVETCMSEFMKAGGSAKCLTIRLDEKAIENREEISTVTSRTVKVTGQLIDSGLMTEMLDIIVNGGGSFRIDELKPGYKKNEVSTAKIEVIAPRDEVLNRLIQKLVRQGATLSGIENGDAILAAVKADGVAPEHFATTTIYPTDIMVNGEWLRVENQRMDGVIVLNNGSAKCSLIRDLKKGDMVVTGGLGVKVSTLSDKSDSGEKFSFMGSGVSSERKVEIAIDRVAWEMGRIKERAGKLVV
ncbi:NG,NG-dimethylarginine dimethylaminohydrolase 1, partial [hydrothermal vent metagenome]